MGEMGDHCGIPIRTWNSSVNLLLMASVNFHSLKNLWTQSVVHMAIFLFADNVVDVNVTPYKRRQLDPCGVLSSEAALS